MGRNWLLSFVERYNIKSYHVGWLKRYSKDDVLKAWTEELCFINTAVQRKNLGHDLN